MDKIWAFIYLNILNKKLKIGSLINMYDKIINNIIPILILKHSKFSNATPDGKNEKQIIKTCHLKYESKKTHE